MIRDAVQALFGALASLPSPVGVLRKGPEHNHEAEAIIDGLKRVNARLRQLESEAP